MHLGINGWPPIASHMGCLILGVALAHLSRGAGNPAPRLPRRSIVLSLPPEAHDGAGTGTTTPFKPGAIQLLRRDAGLPPCRLTDEPVQLLDARGGVFALPWTAAAAVPAVVKAAKTATLSTSDIGAAERFVACSRLPKVTYGAP